MEWTKNMNTCEGVEIARGCTWVARGRCVGAVVVLQAAAQLAPVFRSDNEVV